MTEEQVQTVKDRMENGEELPKIFRDMNIPQEERKTFRQENKELVRTKRQEKVAARKAARPPKNKKQKLQEDIARVEARLAKMKDRLAKEK